MATLAQRIGPLDDGDHRPLYQQLERALREAIESGQLAPDDALPPERDLAADFGVSRITVRKAVDGLVQEGLLVRRQGSGTFVRVRVEKNFSKLTSFSEDMRARGSSLYEALERSGHRPVRALQRLRAVLLDAEQAELLAASEGDPGLLVERIGFDRDGRAIEFSQSWYRGDTYDFVAELSDLS
jgi:GntR family transcriptional regulator